MTKLLLVFLIPILTFCQTKKTDSIRVFYLGGQSNMDGYGYNTDLPNTLKTEFKNVWIFHGNPTPDEKENGGQGIWKKLKQGHGKNFSSNGKQNNYSKRFGVELSFAKKIQSLYPNEKIAIIKYSKGGTSIDSLAAGNAGSWDPDFKGTTGINQYDHFLKTLANAMETTDIDKNGITDTLIPAGILWMQGESDARTEEIANQYFNNLKHLMGLIRAAFRKDDLPIVIGKISDSWNDKDGKVWNYGELIQHAQEKFAKTDNNTSIIRDTRYYKYSDKWHYDSNGYIDLGEKFAKAIYDLNK